jgi:hypothetical protein
MTGLDEFCEVPLPEPAPLGQPPAAMAWRPNSPDDAQCPTCSTWVQADYDEVDVGVGNIRGNVGYQCGCGWVWVP